MLQRLGFLKEFHQRGSSLRYYAKYRIGIRREDKNCWERRVPITPQHVKQLIQEEDIEVVVQPSDIRVFSNEEYEEAGAIIKEDLSECPTIFALKEVPKEKLLEDKTYCFFSHTIKAQPYNMPLLDTILRKNIRLIDYEKFVNRDDRRVVQFGMFAGYAGAIDSLHVLGERLLVRNGFSTPFINVGWAKNYSSLDMAKEAVRLAGEQISKYGIPNALGPFTIVITGTNGAVGQGLKSIIELLPVKYVTSRELAGIWAEAERNKASQSQHSRQKFVYVCLTTAEDMVQHKKDGSFDKKHYYSHPEDYEPIFHKNVIPYCHVLLNGIYWDQRYPRLITREQAKELILQERFPMVVVGDVSCDVGGSVEFFSKSTTIDKPYYVCDIVDRVAVENLNYQGGVAVLGVENWPAAFPRSASTFFGGRLYPYVAPIAKSTHKVSFDEQLKQLPYEVGKAIITTHNQLTPSFQYITSLRKQKEEAKLAERNKGHRVLILGSGYVVAPVVEYLLRHSHISHVVVAGLDEQKSQQLVTEFSSIKGNENRISSLKLNVQDVKDENKLDSLIQENDIVLSLVPATMHVPIAKKCISFKKNMITASYISNEMKQLNEQAKNAGVVILNEIGLDPGIDHMSIMKLIEQVKSQGGNITSFKSFCGALPAPESAKNAIGYKFSWSPRGVLLAAQNSATYLEDGKKVEIDGKKLMFNANPIRSDRLAYPALSFEVIPNRDSISYIDYYGLDKTQVKTMMRGTLRFPGFTNLFRALNTLELLRPQCAVPSQVSNMFEMIKSLIQAPAAIQTEEELADFIASKLKNAYANLIPNQDMNYWNMDIMRAVSAMRRLGLLSKETIIKETENRMVVDVLANHLEKLLSYTTNERDMIYMHHELEVEYQNSKKETLLSTLCVYGDAEASTASPITKKFTATAKTVGYPVAIAAELMLSGNLNSLKGMGVVGPTQKELYEAVLEKLKHEGVVMEETKM